MVKRQRRGMQAATPKQRLLRAKFRGLLRFPVVKKHRLVRVIKLITQNPMA